MFKLQVSKQVAVPVRGTLEDDNGKEVRFDFTLTMTRATAAEIRSIREVDEHGERRSLVDEIAPRVTGWTGIVDAATGEPVPCTAENVCALLEIVGMAALVWTAYLKGCSVRSKEKN